MERNKHWILNAEGEPERAPLEQWGKFIETGNRRIALDCLDHPGDGVEMRVSTVFIGLDYNWGSTDDPKTIQELPHIFETMVFPSHDRH